MLRTAKNFHLNTTKTIQPAHHAMKIVNHVQDLIITTACLVLKDIRKTRRVLSRIRSTVLAAVRLEVMRMSMVFVRHAMKIVKPAPDLIALIA